MMGVWKDKASGFIFFTRPSGIDRLLMLYRDLNLNRFEV